MGGKLYFIVLLLFASFQLFAQHKARAFMSLNKYLRNESQEITIKNVVIQRDVNEYDDEEDTYYIHAVDNEFADLCWGIEIDDHLFLNREVALDEEPRFLSRKHPYALVLFRSEKYLIFRSGLIKGAKGMRRSAGRGNGYIIPVPPVVFAGALAFSVIYSSSEPSIVDQQDYLLDLKTNELIYFNRGLLRNYLDQAIAENDTVAVRFFKPYLKSRE